MTKLSVQEGENLTLKAPYTGVSGQGVLVGSIFGVAMSDFTSGSDGVFCVEGVHTIAKTASQAWTQGDKIYWDNTNHVADNTPTIGVLIGFATADQASSSTGITGQVYLTEGPTRRPLAIAQEGSPTPTSKSGSATLTATEVLSGIIVDNPGNTGIALTFPTAALLVAAVPQAKVGDLIKVLIVNGDATATHIVTLTEGAGGTWDTNQAAGSRIVPVLNSKIVHIRLTNVTAASEAYVMYA